MMNDTITIRHGDCESELLELLVRVAGSPMGERKRGKAYNPKVRQLDEVVGVEQGVAGCDIHVTVALRSRNGRIGLKR